MALVICDKVGKGLRESEWTVAIKDFSGRRQFLRVEQDFISHNGDKQYITVGVIHRNESRGLVLIELPLEADSGANRLWVRREALLEDPVESAL
jgi:hypothetical protein